MFSNSATDTWPLSSSTGAQAAARRPPAGLASREEAAAVTLPGLGHSAHVENPELSITLLDAYR